MTTTRTVIAGLALALPLVGLDIGTGGIAQASTQGWTHAQTAMLEQVLQKDNTAKTAKAFTKVVESHISFATAKRDWLKTAPGAQATTTAVAGYAYLWTLDHDATALLQAADGTVTK